MPWDPRQYLGFAAERARPGLDLLARIPLEGAERIVDLGCGTGNLVPLLRERWPEASILGVDTSAEMLAEAARVPGLRVERADAATWEPAEAPDLIFSNAALHWVGEHGTLFPRLLGFLKPGGCLAVQMPGSWALPHHRAAHEAAEDPRWRDCLRPALPRDPVAPLTDYHRWLAPSARRLDLWESTYLHLLEGEDPVTEWFKGSLLVPLLEALPPEHREPFVAAYRARVQAAYPPGPGGRTPMPFRRVFIVASR
ncbi:MAG: methyltransferase domain-containing protein [Acidobacteria bacterium]|nr:methyltransferase domain-containing protein [Acidobacteriota bacterium]